MLRAFNEKTGSLKNSDWVRGYGDWYKLEPADYIPSTNTGGCLWPNPEGGCSDAQNTVEADAIFTLIPLLQSIDVDCQTVEDLRLWAKEMWPLGDWDQFIQGSCTGIYLQNFDLVVELNQSVQHTLTEGQEIVMSELELRNGLNIYVDGSVEVGSIVFDLNSGEVNVTDNDYPFALFGDGDNYTEWAINPGNYTLNAKAFSQDNGGGDLLDEVTVNFTVVKGVYLEGISLVQQGSGQLVTNLEPDIEYNVEEFPAVLLNIRARTEAVPHVGSIQFDLDNGDRIYTDNLSPYYLYGSGADFSPWSPDPGTHTLNVKVFAETDGGGEMIDEQTYTYTYIEDQVLGIEDHNIISIHPNPTSGKLILGSSSIWKIIDTKGLEFASGHSEEIDVSYLPNGAYLLILEEKKLRFIKY
jgi:hypothetical protein